MHYRVSNQGKYPVTFEESATISATGPGGSKKIVCWHAVQTSHR
jgi:hypothetical protein